MFHNTVVELLQSLSGTFGIPCQGWVLTNGGSVYLLNHGPAHELVRNKAFQQIPNIDQNTSP